MIFKFNKWWGIIVRLPFDYCHLKYFPQEDSVIGADVTTSESGFQDDSAEIGVYFQSLSTKMISEEPKLKVRA